MTRRFSTSSAKVNKVHAFYDKRFLPVDLATALKWLDSGDPQSWTIRANGDQC